MRNLPVMLAKFPKFGLFSVIHFLLDDILGSAVIRCLEKDKSGMLMEPNAVEIICERF